MKGGERDEKDSTAFGGSRGDFVELDSSTITRPLPVVRIDGPYGAPAEDVFNVEIAVLVGAGIGMGCRFIPDSSAHLNRCYTLRLNSETYLVSSAERPSR